jgi:hypothetical protein
VQALRIHHDILQSVASVRVTPGIVARNCIRQLDRAGRKARRVQAVCPKLRNQQRKVLKPEVRGTGLCGFKVSTHGLGLCIQLRPSLILQVSHNISGL